MFSLKVLQTPPIFGIWESGQEIKTYLSGSRSGHTFRKQTISLSGFIWNIYVTLRLLGGLSLKSQKIEFLHTLCMASLTRLQKRPLVWVLIISRPSMDVRAACPIARGLILHLGGGVFLDLFYLENL